MIRFLNPKAILALIVAGVIGLAVLKFIGMSTRLSDTTEQLLTRTEQVVELTETTEVLIRQNQQLKRAVDVANEVRVSAEKEAARYREIVSEIVDNEDLEDGPIAPVLRDTLDALRMR